jgi:hypothetical protein
MAAARSHAVKPGRRRVTHAANWSSGGARTGDDCGSQTGAELSDSPKEGDEEAVVKWWGFRRRRLRGRRWAAAARSAIAGDSVECRPGIGM